MDIKFLEKMLLVLSRKSKMKNSKVIQNSKFRIQQFLFEAQYGEKSNLFQSQDSFL